MKIVVNPKYSKGKGEYEKVINTIEAEGKCPFCPKNFKYHKKKTLNKKGGWLITNNTWPYKNARIHLLIISMKHKEEFEELTPKDFADVSNLTRWAIKKFKIKGGALTIRFGDTDYTGATVCHIHFHLISPRRSRGEAKFVVFPIG